jgi:Domain of unknown function (DUF4177)
MTTWEYVTMLWSEKGTFSGAGGHAGLQEMLEQHGADGWELAATVPLRSGAMSFIFKRPAS